MTSTNDTPSRRITTVDGAVHYHQYQQQQQQELEQQQEQHSPSYNHHHHYTHSLSFFLQSPMSRHNRITSDDSIHTSLSRFEDDGVIDELLSIGSNPGGGEGGGVLNGSDMPSPPSPDAMAQNESSASSHWRPLEMEFQENCRIPNLLAWSVDRSNSVEPTALQQPSYVRFQQQQQQQQQQQRQRQQQRQAQPNTTGINHADYRQQHEQQQQQQQQQRTPPSSPESKNTTTPWGELFLQSNKRDSYHANYQQAGVLRQDTTQFVRPEAPPVVVVVGGGTTTTAATTTATTTSSEVTAIETGGRGQTEDHDNLGTEQRFSFSNDTTPEIIIDVDPTPLSEIKRRMEQRQAAVFVQGSQPPLQQQQQQQQPQQQHHDQQQRFLRRFGPPVPELLSVPNTQTLQSIPKATGQGRTSIAIATTMASPTRRNNTTNTTTTLQTPSSSNAVLTPLADALATAAAIAQQQQQQQQQQQILPPAQSPTGPTGLVAATNKVTLTPPMIHKRSLSSSIPVDVTAGRPRPNYTVPTATKYVVSQTDKRHERMIGFGNKNLPPPAAGTVKKSNRKMTQSKSSTSVPLLRGMTGAAAATATTTTTKVSPGTVANAAVATTTTTAAVAGAAATASIGSLMLNAPPPNSLSSMDQDEEDEESPSRVPSPSTSMGNGNVKSTEAYERKKQRAKDARVKLNDSIDRLAISINLAGSQSKQRLQVWQKLSAIDDDKRGSTAQVLQDTIRASESARKWDRPSFVGTAAALIQSLNAQCDAFLRELIALKEDNNNSNNKHNSSSNGGGAPWHKRHPSEASNSSTNHKRQRIADGGPDTTSQEGRRDDETVFSNQSILERMASYLDPRTSTRCQSVAKLWKLVFRSDTVWQELCQTRFGLQSVRYWRDQMDDESDDTSYRMLFQMMDRGNVIPHVPSVTGMRLLGQARLSGKVSAWTFVIERSNGETLRSVKRHDVKGATLFVSLPVVELRTVVQNTGLVQPVAILKHLQTVDNSTRRRAEELREIDWDERFGKRVLHADGLTPYRGMVASDELCRLPLFGAVLIHTYIYAKGCSTTSKFIQRSNFTKFLIQVDGATIPLVIPFPKENRS